MMSFARTIGNRWAMVLVILLKDKNFQNLKDLEMKEILIKG